MEKEKGKRKIVFFMGFMKRLGIRGKRYYRYVYRDLIFLIGFCFWVFYLVLIDLLVD